MYSDIVGFSYFVVKNHFRGFWSQPQQLNRSKLTVGINWSSPTAADRHHQMPIGTSQYRFCNAKVQDCFELNYTLYLWGIVESWHLFINGFNKIWRSGDLKATYLGRIWFLEHKQAPPVLSSSLNMINVFVDVLWFSALCFFFSPQTLAWRPDNLENRFLN